MNAKDFQPGEAVSYVPMHAHGDLGHPDVEHGTVTSTNDRFVFVAFSYTAGRGIACEPDDLRRQFGSRPLQGRGS